MLKELGIKLDARVIKIIKTITVILLFWLGGYYFKFIPIILFNLRIESLTMRDQLLLSMFSSSLLAIIFLLIYRKDLVKEFKKFKKNFMFNMDQGLRFWLLGLLIMVVSNFILTFILKAGGANNENALQEMIKQSPSYLMLVTAGILAPFNEEIVFRKSIKDCVSNKWIFVLFAFLLFGGAHVIGSAETFLDYLYILPYGALGGVFALAYYETDTVFTSMTFHMIHNIILVILSII